MKQLVKQQISKEFGFTPDFELRDVDVRVRRIDEEFLNSQFNESFIRSAAGGCDVSVQVWIDGVAVTDMMFASESGNIMSIETTKGESIIEYLSRTGTAVKSHITVYENAELHWDPSRSYQKLSFWKLSKQPDLIPAAISKLNANAAAHVAALVGEI